MGMVPAFPELENAAAGFLRDGAVLMRNFISPEQCDIIRGQIEAFVARYAGYVNHEDEAGIIMLHGSRFKGLHGAPSLFLSPKPVVVRRGDPGQVDGNMIDIYNADRVVPGLYDLFNNSLIRPLLAKAMGEPVYLQTINAYISRSVTNPRGYHWDTDFSWYKALLYLTDVNSEADGPYSYVVGSQHPDIVRKNVQAVADRQKRGEPAGYGDVFDYDHERVKVFLAPRGTMALSDQSGAHRGLPQRPEHYRVVVVPSFLTQSTLNRMGPAIGFPNGPRLVA